LTVAAVAAFVAGVGFLVVPDLTLAPFGAVVDPTGVLMTLYGAMHLGLGTIDWLARDVDGEQTRRALAAGNLLYFTLAAVLTASGLVAGLASLPILALTALFAGLAIAFLRSAVVPEASLGR
jgi:hypothetical protein